MNVLFITADQWRGDCPSSAGHPAVRTPALDALAGDGVRFACHFSQATPCGPARASIHTGLYALNHRSITNGHTARRAPHRPRGRGAPGRLPADAVRLHRQEPRSPDPAAGRPAPALPRGRLRELRGRARARPAQRDWLGDLQRRTGRSFTLDDVFGGVVAPFTEHVDLMPTILERLDLEVPLQCDGRSLLPFVRGACANSWRDAAHYEHDFRDIESLAFETRHGLSSDRCALAVRHGPRFTYVHFNGLPPLCFDLERDPAQFVNIALDPARAPDVLAQVQAMLDPADGHGRAPADRLQADPLGVIGRF